MSEANPGAEPYLSFLRLPRMGQKPRASGILIASDFEPGHGAVEEILLTRSSIVDFAKLPDHVGNVAFYSERWFRERIELYHRYDVKVFPGGVTFEVAEAQGRAERLFEALR